MACGLYHSGQVGHLHNNHTCASCGNEPQLYPTPIQEPCASCIKSSCQWVLKS